MNNSNGVVGMGAKTVMSAISEDVNWREDRDEIIRYADENLAVQHPTVTKMLSELKKENRELKQRLYEEQDYFRRLLQLSNFHFWNLPRLKQLLRERSEHEPRLRSS